MPTTGRAVRIRKLLKEMIASGKKITTEDMKKLQGDLYDEYAMILFPKMMDIVEKNKGKYFGEKSEEMKILNRMERLLANYSGEVFVDSKQALIYNTWYGEIADSLFTNAFNDDYERDSMIGSFFADHFYGNMILRWAAGNDTSAPFCENPYNQQRSHKCIFNVVNGLLRAYRSIVSALGKDEVVLA